MAHTLLFAAFAQLPPFLALAAEPDPAFLDLSVLRDLVRRKKWSARSVASHFLNRIDRLDGTSGLRAFVLVDRAGAMSRADELDRLARSHRSEGALFGVPIALKDDLEVARLPLSLGSELLPHWTPPDDATAVKKLRAAGAILIGKTNLDEFTLGVTGRNSRFGQTRNPYAPGRIPGGSSAGSACAVASGLCTGALGSDASGSVLLAASACGVVGYRPTLGAISRHGLTPMVPTKDALGVLARSVRDAALIAGTLAGADPLDPLTFGAPAWKNPDFAKSSLRGLRIGNLAAYSRNADPFVGRVTEDAAAKLRALGARVEVAIPFPANELMETGNIINGVEFLTFIELAVRRANPEIESSAMIAGMDPATAVFFRAFGKIEALRYCFALKEGRAAVVRHYAELFRDFDVLLLPTNGTLPFAVEDRARLAGADAGSLRERYVAFRGNAEVAGLAGLPAISLPAGLAPGNVPVGVQLIAPPFADARLFSVAHAFERKRGPFPRPALT